MRNIARILLPIVIQSLSLLYVLTVSRVLLMLINYNDVASQNIFTLVIREGFEFDLLLVGFLLLVPSILLPALTSAKNLLPAWRYFIPGYSAVCITLVVTMEAVTPDFLKHFNSRPNQYFSDYIVDSMRSIETPGTSHFFALLILFVFVTLMIVGVFVYFRKLLSNVQTIQLIHSLPIGLLMILICVITANLSSNRIWVNSIDSTVAEDELREFLPPSSIVYFTYTVMGNHGSQ